LSNRRAGVFRIGKLKYPEIESIDEAAAELVAHNLADTDPPSEISELLAAFTKPELLKLLDLAEQRQLSRPALEQHIIDRQQADDIVSLQQADRWIRNCGLDAYRVFKLCFFGNCYQDMSEFVLRDLGVFNYEQSPIDKQSRVFQSREQLNAHLQYFACVSALEDTDHADALALLAVDKALPNNKSYDAHLIRRVDRLRNAIARALERLNSFEEALALYQHSESATK